MESIEESYWNRLSKKNLIKLNLAAIDPHFLLHVIAGPFLDKNIFYVRIVNFKLMLFFVDPKMVRTYKNIKYINANLNTSTVEAAVKLVVKKKHIYQRSSSSSQYQKVYTKRLCQKIQGRKRLMQF